ncbi:MAG: MBOAT family O-acyltransferase [Alphaproteobacteria bacterium]|nr:MBOAT family O-acyltransferase [Alphaproteobacteria bacterium]
MLFSSPVFFAFFAVYFAIYLVTPERFRLLLIIVGSTIFYGYWEPLYTWIPFVLILTAYFGGLWMDRAASERGRKRRLAATIVVLMLPLAIFKYTDFVWADVLGPIAGTSGTILGLPLPLGVSFITFTLIAYLVDVFARRFHLESRIQTLAAYTLFFPHLIAGPILRPHELIPQLDRPIPIREAKFVAGIAIFSVGLLKKLFFADQIAQVVDRVYADPMSQTALDAWLAIYGFSVQIYCDFSGYTDMAIGTALIIGVRLPNNFARPYGAASITEFWRRWHITLSYWLRDYLYIPLGGNRGGAVRQTVNIMITMLLGGLWHGASWTFVIWGGLHGLAVSLVHLKDSVLGGVRLPRWLGTVITFHFVTFVWILFRAPDMEIAAAITGQALFGPLGDPLGFARANAFPLLLLVLFLSLHRFDDHRRFRIAVKRWPSAVVWPSMAAMWMLSIAISTGSSAAFIYFDF